MISFFSNQSPQTFNANDLVLLGRSSYIEEFNDEYYNGNDRYDLSNEKHSRRNVNRRGKNDAAKTGSAIESLLKNQKQLGAVLLGVGFLLSLMGIMLFFEGNLMRIGNICFIAGIFLLIGPSRVSGYFLNESRLQATTISGIGVLLVLFGKPKIGILIEIFGLLNLFGNMFPLLLALGKKMPIIGDVLSSFDSSNEEPKKDKKMARDRDHTDYQRPRRPPTTRQNSKHSHYDPSF
mmetsp:Transcript_26700/g.38176  ORF Transcript_26700/g.38176 Transcript_26700/m.38176 type:complete len:235 (+) Transcript_26700:2377-3081(+)